MHCSITTRENSPQHNIDLPPFPGRCSFYLITPGWGDLKKISAILIPLIRAGLPALQIREPDVADKDLFRWICNLAEIISVENLPCKLFVNSRIEMVKTLCERFPAQRIGLHLKDGKLRPGEAKAYLGKDVPVGISSHRYGDKEKQDDGYLSYRSLSPIYPPLSKQGIKPLGLDALKECADNSPVPVFALGGITYKNLPHVLDAGANGAGVIGAVFNAKKPHESFRELALTSFQIRS